MHWNAADGRDHEALRRLAVVLLTLAASAESVAGRSWPLRGLVLWMLSRAEARVRNLASTIGASTALATFPVASPASVLGGSGEAVRLAHAFRTFAAVFFALSRQAPQWLRMARRHDTVCVLGNSRNPSGPGRVAGTRQPWRTDTS